MCRLLIISIATLLTRTLQVMAVSADIPLTDLSLNQLEQRLVEIDAELTQLAHYSLRSGIGSIGYRSKKQENADMKEWVEIEFDREFPINEIVLVPTIRRDTEKGFQGDSFPPAFRIIAGTAGNPTGTVVAEYEEGDHIQPRIAPLAVPIPEMSASWVRVEATRLSARAFDGNYVFQLSELLVFSGQKNVALHQTVKTSSNMPDRAGAWSASYLVDGFMPYLMDAAQGSQSLAYVSEFGAKPVLMVDLEQSLPISRIHLHAVDQSDTVPQAYAGDLGIPHHLKVEGANRADFTDGVTLIDYRQSSINDTGPIMMWNIPETICRYVRIKDADPVLSSGMPANTFRIGFAEIELFSKGRNVALGKATNNNEEFTRRSPAALTDGNNLYGKILPVRKWLNELTRRHDLEALRPAIVKELNHRYTRQKANLNRVSWLAALLVVAVAFTFLIDRMLRLRQVARIRERFAADLHDELGANLHAIGLLGDLAKDAVYSPEELIETVDEIRALTERSGAAARNCADMQQADIFGKLPDDMRRTARRIMADLEYDISIEGEELLEKLKPRTKADLFLFYKESLVNISRHSEATEVTIKLLATSKELSLTIQDNGLGLEGDVPSSLKRRARLLGGQVACTASSNEGTCITLKFQPRKFGLRK